MPPKKKGARGGKASPRGRGRGKAKAVEEVVEEEQNTEEDEPSQDSDAAEDTSQDMEAEEESESQEETAEDTSLTNGKSNKSAKRKAESEEDEADEDEEGDEDSSDQPSTKKMKTEKKEEEPTSVTLACSNLEEDLTAEALQEFFESNDVTVTDVKKEADESTGQVVVDPENAEAALALSGKELGEKEIKIEKVEKSDKSTSGDDRTLFIKNLTESCTEETLKDFFADEGVKITEVRLPRKRDGHCKGFGYVVFETVAMMEERMKTKQGAEFNGEKVFLDYTNDKSSFKGKDRKGLREFGPSKVLFVRNLAFSVSEDELKDTFSGCVAVRIPPNEYGQPKGFGFVEYKTVEDAEKAQKEKDGLEINGRIVQLAFANDKPTGLGGAGGGGGFRGGRGGWVDRGRGFGGRGGGGGWGGGRGGFGGGRGGGGGWGGRGGWGPGGGGFGGGGRGGFGGADLSAISWEEPGYYETKAVIDALKDDNDCLDSSGIKKNGSTWHPNIDWIEATGQIDCISCQCINGEIKCRKDCVPDEELPCKKPRKHKGQCCKTCPDKKRRRKKTKGEKKNGRKDGKRKKDRKRCKGKNKDKKRCRRPKASLQSSRKERTTASGGVLPTATPGVHVQNLCLKKSTKYLVYKVIGTTEMLIGFDDIAAETVDLFRWSINKENSRQMVSFIGEESVSALDFRRTINNTNVIGTTGNKHYKRFKRRLKDKLEKCSSLCEPELFIKIIQRVKVRLLKFRENCKS